MSVYSYVVEHDMGFAPNPFHGFCTLACCMPTIRERAEHGDLIVGTSGMKSGRNGHIVYWMIVEEIISFDEYWNDDRFLLKRPNVEGSTVMQYGDNIYHSAPSEPYKQAFSFHSLPDGGLNTKNLITDTRRTSNVLIASNFAYWGGHGPKIPENLQDIVKTGRNYKKEIPTQKKDAILKWLSDLGCHGYVSDPAAWQKILPKL